MSEPISTTELCRRLGVGVTCKLLKDLGIQPFAVEGINHWWDEDQYIDICEALAKFIANGGHYLK